MDRHSLGKPWRCFGNKAPSHYEHNHRDAPAGRLYKRIMLICLELAGLTYFGS